MFSNNFNFELVANTISGPNSINKVYEFLKEKNYKKVGLILDNNLFKKSNYAKIFLKKIKKRKILKK